MKCNSSWPLKGIYKARGESLLAVVGMTVFPKRVVKSRGASNPSLIGRLFRGMHQGSTTPYTRTVNLNAVISPAVLHSLVDTLQRIYAPRDFTSRVAGSAVFWKLPALLAS